MTIPTAEWCHDVAMLYDGRAGLQRSAGQYREANQDTRISAALRIAARVLDERTEDRIHDSVLLVINGDISEHEAVSDILAYLKGDPT